MHWAFSLLAPCDPGASTPEASSGGESHPSALTEPDVKFSLHPAPTLQRRFDTELPQDKESWVRLCLRHRLLPSRVDCCPRLESRAPSLHPRYQASSLPRAHPPLRLASVRSSSWVLHLDFSLRIEAVGSHVPHKSLHWIHAVFMPVTTRTVRTHPPSCIPGQRMEPGFGDVSTVSTCHQRFTRVRLPSAHLTSTSRLFRTAHHHGCWAVAAFGGLDPDRAVRVRRAHPHLLCSRRLNQPQLFHGLLSAPSWRTYVTVIVKRSTKLAKGFTGYRGQSPWLVKFS